MSFFPQNKQKVVVLVAEQFLLKCIIADTTRIRAPWGFKVLFFIYFLLLVRSLGPTAVGSSVPQIGFHS